MEVDHPDPAQSTTAKTKKEKEQEKKEKEKQPTTASKPPSPKSARAAKDKDTPPKLPQGSGLISNALFGVDENAEASDAHSTPNIILHIPLNDTNNRIINFARLAEEQYGFAALHPRLAAHKERLARVAAAGAALERNEKGAKGLLSAGESADEDLSLDMDRDSDLDGDIAMAGINTNGAAPADGTEGKKKRRKKMEEYDRDDPFVDDSEMAWQEHAAASKDGYFVYSGPLVPEGEKVQVERLAIFSPPAPDLFAATLTKTGPMEQSNEVEDVDEEAVVVHQPTPTRSLSQLLSPFPKKPVFPFVAPDLAVAVQPVVHASAKPHASRSKRRNKPTTPPMAPHRKVVEEARQAVEADLAVEEARFHHQQPPTPLPTTTITTITTTTTIPNSHHDQISPRHPLDRVLYPGRSW